MTEEKKLKIADFMRPKEVVSTISVDATFEDAAKIMIEKKRNGLVVLDKDKKVIGMLSSLHLIKFIVPDYLEDDKHLAAFEATDVFAKRVHEIKNEPIVKFMNHNYHAVKAEESLMEAANLMSEWNTRHLPVVDDQNMLVGYITRTDVKKAIAQILHIKEPH